MAQAPVSEAPWVPPWGGVLGMSTRRRPQDGSRTCWRDKVSQLAWECLRILPEELEQVSVLREIWASVIRLLTLRLGPREAEDERRKKGNPLVRGESREKAE